MNGPGQATSTRAVLLTVVIVVAVLHLAKEIFIPLALAILFTFLLAPLVGRLTRWGVNRLLAVLVSVAIALALIGTLANLAFNQFTDLAHELPGYQRQLHENLTHIRGALRGGIADASNAIEQISKELQRVAPGQTLPNDVRKVQVVEPPPTPVQMLKGLVGPLLKPFGTALVVITLVIFMLLRLHDLRERLIRVLGRRNLYHTTEALGDAAQRVSRYLLMQLLINSWTGLIVGLGLWALNVPNPGLWGALAMLLRFIPYAGVWTAAVVPFLLSFAVSDDLTRPMLVLALFAILELFNYTVLEPWLYANQTGISPVALLLAAAFWTWLWGGAGLLLSIPMTVCVAVMSKYIPQLEFLLVLLGDEPVLEPHQRLYQRLLASNRDASDTLLDEALRVFGSLLNAADAVIVPTIRLMEADYDQRALGATKRKIVLEHINQWVEERLDSLDDMAQTNKANESYGDRSTRGATAPAVASLSSPAVASAQASTPAPDPRQPWILCIPAADRADEVVAKLLVSALLERGLGAAFLKPEALERLSLSGGQGGGHAVDAVVVSALPPEALGPARAVCRAVRAQTQELPLVVGLWDPDGGDLQKPRQRLEAAGAGQVVVRFAECVTALDALLTAGAGIPMGQPSAPARQGHLLQA
jgi:predicted PurR-regulated permease PerM